MQTSYPDFIAQGIETNAAAKGEGYSFMWRSSISLNGNAWTFD
jgi:hypothetical protein